jgi:hypothetical protein
VVPRHALAVATAAVVLLAASAAAALEIHISPARLQGGTVWVDAWLADLFAPRVEQSLGRGMPATLIVRAELWRRRTAWFDRLSGSFDAAVKIRYDVWSRAYRLERPGAATVVASTLDSLRLVLSEPMAFPLARIETLPAKGRYYVAVFVTLKPLTVEDVEEGEGWLAGEAVNKRDAGVGVVTAIPHSVFDAVRNFAGFGDERTRALGEEFELGDLSEPR